MHRLRDKIMDGRKGSTVVGQKHNANMTGERASPQARADSIFGQTRRQPKMFRAGLETLDSIND